MTVVAQRELLIEGFGPVPFEAFKTMLRFRPVTISVLLVSVLGAVIGCRESDPVQIVNVSLSNTELYQFPTVGGDEEGARISTQAKHHSVSEIRRSAETDFVATYVYQATPGFVGSDEAEIEVLTGSDGASAPKDIKRIVFRFAIHN